MYKKARNESMSIAQIFFIYCIIHFTLLVSRRYVIVLFMQLNTGGSWYKSTCVKYFGQNSCICYTFWGEWYGGEILP